MSLLLQIAGVVMLTVAYFFLFRLLLRPGPRLESYRGEE